MATQKFNGFKVLTDLCSGTTFPLEAVTRISPAMSLAVMWHAAIISKGG